jgi:alpha-1,6-mannosyltransferase
MTAAGSGAGRALVGLMGAYAVAVALLMAVSARLWWQAPMVLTAHEFDFFLGWFSGLPAELAAERVLQGRWLHLGACLVVGLLYLGLVLQLARQPQALTPRTIAGYAASIAALFALGMPWLSPDVFFYIGTGWLESHYGVSPYRVTVGSLQGFRQDEMFNNIFPGFLNGTTAYGPLFQKVAALLSGLSFGHEKLALALHKGANLLLHGAACGVVWRLAPAALKPVALLSYGANPVILFSVLTCAHNDAWMNLGVLLALLALHHGRWLLCGAALGAAFCIKYFPLVFLPVLLLGVTVRLQDGRWRLRHLADAALLLAGFAAVAVAAHALYPESLPQFTRTATTGVSVYRNSIYHFVDLLYFFLLPLLFDVRAVWMSYGDLGRVFRIGYMALYPVVLLAFVPRLRRNLLEGSAEACLVVAVLYFIVVNTTNQEWYLTWLMGFAFVLPQLHARMLAWRLSVYFLPVVIFTVKNLPSAVLFSNAWLYATVLALGATYLWQVLRARPDGRPPVPAQAA